MGAHIIALAVGTLFGVALLAGAKRLNKFYELTNETLKTVGPILFVTAAGGVLGKVIAVSGMVETITANASILEAVGIFFPFLLSAILKTAQGSSTVALTTTAGIMAPLMDAMGLGTPVRAALTVMAIAAGAMTVSHANDSYFWVVTNFGEMKRSRAIKRRRCARCCWGFRRWPACSCSLLFSGNGVSASKSAVPNVLPDRAGAGALPRLL